MGITDNDHVHNIKYGGPETIDSCLISGVPIEHMRARRRYNVSSEVATETINNCRLASKSEFHSHLYFVFTNIYRLIERTRPMQTLHLTYIWEPRSML